MSRRRRSIIIIIFIIDGGSAMPLDELGRWLQARAERRPSHQHPDARRLLTAIVAVGIDRPSTDLPLLAIDADAFNHGGSRSCGDLRRRASPQRHQQHALDRSASVRAIHQRKPTARSMHVPGAWDSTPPWQPRLSAWAPLLDTRNIKRPAAVHPAALCGRPGIRDRIAKEGPQDRGFSAARHTDIQRSSRPCANTGRSATPAPD